MHAAAAAATHDPLILSTVVRAATLRTVRLWGLFVFFFFFHVSRFHAILQSFRRNLPDVVENCRGPQETSSGPDSMPLRIDFGRPLPPHPLPPPDRTFPRIVTLVRPELRAHTLSHRHWSTHARAHAHTRPAAYRRSNANPTRTFTPEGPLACFA